MRLTPVALGSAGLAAAPLVNVFTRYTWAWQSALVLAAMALTGALLRRRRTPAWAPSLAMAAAGLLTLAVLFPGRHPADLIGEASQQLHRFAAPVGDHDGLRFLTIAGIALLGLVVDVLVVELRRPALAGLPMLAVYTVPVAALRETTDWWPFALGALGFVWLLAADRIAHVRTFGRRIGGQGALSLAAAGRVLGLAGVALAVALPFLLPAALVPAQPWSPGAGKGQPAGDVDLLALLSGELNRPEAVPLLDVTGDDPQPGNLRLATLEQLTNDGFGRLPHGTTKPVTSGLPRPAWGPETRTSTHRAEVRINARFSAGTLPVYGWPTSIRGVDDSWLFEPRTQMVYSEQRTTANQRYTMEYVRPEAGPDALRRAPAVDDADPALRELRSVPPNLVVQSLLPGLIAGQATEYDKVQAIKAFFSPANHFVYDTRTGPDTSGSAITDFLRDRRGFCTQYAAAFAWLLRAAGIPARVAIGFVDRPGGHGRTTTLTSHDLHAWTEAFFPGYGWIPFDATPPATTGAPTPAPSSIAPTATTAASPAPVTPAAPGPTQEPPWELSGLLLLLALLAVPALTRSRTRRRRLQRATAHDAWAELLDTMADYRLTPGAGETPRAVARRLAGLDPSALAGVQALRTAEEHERYAARPLPPPDLRTAIRAVRTGLAAGRGRRARFTAAVLPPSVLRRWFTKARRPRRAARGTR
ncbi:transglutaminaseTgpA domain-containing protein [Dactylosporangium sp. CS-047395]|uniref:transglutaminase TgpA family protein n=1 Tax=Dactylosporangium sp. CS-047395 TaxID=3239936 RepID=UPI003D8BD87E